MNNIIKISLIDIKEKNELENIIESEESDIMNFEIVQEVVNTIGLGIYHSIKDILYYLISQLQKQKILKSSDPIIHLHVSDDEWNIEKKNQTCYGECNYKDILNIHILSKKTLAWEIIRL